jgi:hypothetical protein
MSVADEFAKEVAAKTKLRLSNIYIIETLEVRFGQIDEKIKTRILLISSFDKSNALHRFSAVANSLDEFVGKFDAAP